MGRDVSSGDMSVVIDCVKRSTSSTSSRLPSSSQSAPRIGSSSHSDKLITFSNRDRSVVSAVTRISFITYVILLPEHLVQFYVFLNN